jgi:hypothetical protein
VAAAADRDPSDWWRVLAIPKVVQAIVGVRPTESAGILAKVFHAKSDRTDTADSNGAILRARDGTDIAVH